MIASRLMPGPKPSRMRKGPPLLTATASIHNRNVRTNRPRAPSCSGGRDARPPSLSGPRRRSCRQLSKPAMRPGVFRAPGDLNPLGRQVITPNPRNGEMSRNVKSTVPSGSDAAPSAAAALTVSSGSWMKGPAPLTQLSDGIWRVTWIMTAWSFVPGVTNATARPRYAVARAQAAG